MLLFGKLISNKPAWPPLLTFLNMNKSTENAVATFFAALILVGIPFNILAIIDTKAHGESGNGLFRTLADLSEEGCLALYFIA
jgi:hypothetical protein